MALTREQRRELMPLNAEAVDGFRKTFTELKVTAARENGRQEGNPGVPPNGERT